jgi:hypothetical protein
VWGVLDLWVVCRPPGPMGGRQHLMPGPGGAGDQPAALTDAFQMIDQLLAQRTP